MTQIYPKVLDGLTGSIVIQFSNGIPIFFFGYSQYENVNYDTGTYDSAYTYGTKIPLSEFSYNYIQDANDSNKAIYLKVSCGIHTFEFSEGEYQDGTTASPLVIMDVVNAINTAIGF